jgi:hypothetical protein
MMIIPLGVHHIAIDSAAIVSLIATSHSLRPLNSNK